MASVREPCPPTSPKFTNYNALSGHYKTKQKLHIQGFTFSLATAYGIKLWIADIGIDIHPPEPYSVWHHIIGVFFFQAFH